MSRGINKVILIGQLGADPEIKGDGGIANISIATNESWKDKNTGQQQEKTEWHRCVAFKRLAEIAGQYLKKGSKVYVEGKLQTRKWQGQDGKDNYTTEIVINELQMLDGRSQDGQQGGVSPMQNQGGQQQGNQQQGNQQQGGQQQQQQGNQQQGFQGGQQNSQQQGFQDQSGQQQQQQGNQQQGFQNNQGNQQQQGSQQQSAPAPNQPSQADFDDDIPF